MIRGAVEKIAHFKPDKFILNSAFDHNSDINDWMPSLTSAFGFPIEYWDRSWVELRLDNRRQDLRRSYFGMRLEHHSWESLLSICTGQIERTLRGLSMKYTLEHYIAREAEGEFDKFRDSDKLCLIFVDRAGRGKTNLVCALATDHVVRRMPAVFLPGDTTLVDEHSLGRLLAAQLGYDAGHGLRYEAGLQDMARLLQARGERCYVFLDGISQSDDLPRMTRALRTLLLALDELKAFKVCVTCRDLAWPLIAPELPSHLLYATRQAPTSHETDMDVYQVPIGDFSDAELEAAIERYATTYSVTFAPTSTARDQLRHPLLLRLFCEANRSQTLGVLESVPVQATFDQYLRMKTAAVASRIGPAVTPSLVRRFLMNLARRVWDAQSTIPFTDADVAAICPPSVTGAEARLLLHLLAEEGVVVFREEPLAPERTVHLVFEALQDYLLLIYLIAKLPDALRPTEVVLRNPHKLFDYYNQPDKRSEGYLLFALLGMLLSDHQQRGRFLRRLLRWDFPTYCSCLARIPPTSRFTRCSDDSLQMLGQELRKWYAEVVTEKLDQIKQVLDPFRLASSVSGLVAIDLTASPGCREVSYHYKLVGQLDEQVHVTLSESYPTWSVAVVEGNMEVKLHDPDNGILVPVFRGGANIGTKRTFNVMALPFSGATLNVPERIALHDVWDEIEYLVNTSALLFDARPLLAERARATAKTIPELAGKVEGLTEERLNQQMARLLTGDLSGLPRYTQQLARLSELRTMLRRLGEPLPSFDLPQPDLPKRPVRDKVLHDDYSDEALGSYLRDFVVVAFHSYMTLANLNLGELAPFLNTYLQFPCAIIVTSDRHSVRYAFAPVEDEAEAKAYGKVIPRSEDGVGVADWQIQADRINLQEHTLKALEARPARRTYVPTNTTEERALVHPIDVVAPIDEFFGSTPINDLVKRWLKADLRQVFGF